MEILSEMNLSNIIAYSFHFTYMFPRPSLTFHIQCYKNYVIFYIIKFRWSIMHNMDEIPGVKTQPIAAPVL